MGGHYKGDVASQIIVNVFEENFSKNNETEVTVPDGEIANQTIIDNMKVHTNRLLNSSIKESTNNIMDFAKKNNIRESMGATIVGLYQSLNSKDLAIFHLGDSKAYRIRNSIIEELTVDHSEYEEKKQSGKYKEEELKKISKSKITKAVGNFNAFELTINYTNIKIEDIYILCSDGISDLCEKEEILEIVQEHSNNFDNIKEDIKNMIYSRGARDNLSIILILY